MHMCTKLPQTHLQLVVSIGFSCTEKCLIGLISLPSVHLAFSPKKTASSDWYSYLIRKKQTSVAEWMRQSVFAQNPCEGGFLILVCYVCFLSFLVVPLAHIVAVHKLGEKRRSRSRSGPKRWSWFLSRSDVRVRGLRVSNPTTAAVPNRMATNLKAPAADLQIQSL